MKYPNLFPKSCLAGLWLVHIIVFFIVISKTISAQTFILEKEYSSEKNFLGEDALGNQYFLAFGELIRINASGETDAYTNRQFGSDLHVDIADPLNVLVFFKDFGNIILLDNNLTEKNSFSNQQLLSNARPGMVCTSSKNGFWAWFPDVYKLMRFDYNVTSQAVSDDMSMHYPVPGFSKYMVESNNKLFMATDTGVWVFDQHANFLFTISDLMIDYFQVFGNKIIYRKANNLHIYDFFLNQENVFLLPETHVEHFFLLNNKTIYIQTKELLRKYSFSGMFF